MRWGMKGCACSEPRWPGRQGVAVGVGERCSVAGDRDIHLGEAILPPWKDFSMFVEQLFSREQSGGSTAASK